MADQGDRRQAEREHAFKELAYEQLSLIGKALGAPTRLVLMNILSQGEHSVDELAKAARQSVANTSRHLQVLRSAGLVSRI